MERSLSVLMPVQNAQCSLAGAVLELLEVLPELTHRFELIIVDDGSTDATLEVADDLAARFPQVHVIYHAESLGRAGAIRSGLARAGGDVIFLRDDNGCLAIDEIQKLWREIDSHPLVLGRADTTRWANRWMGWDRPAGEGEFRMIHRKVIHGAHGSLEEQLRLAAGPAGPAPRWHEVEVSARATRGPVAPPSAPQTRRRMAGRQAAGSELHKPRRPSYLRALRDLALGE